MLKHNKEAKINGLIAILKNISDLDILKNEGWYRIPVKSAPRRWPPEWIAFYQPKSFGDYAYLIKYFGYIKEIKKVKRYQIFPNELPSIKSETEYYQIFIEELLERPSPIISARPRRLVFIPTTWYKFENASIINDLFDDSPLEDKLWVEFKKQNIDAERQWRVNLSDAYYYLDFAIFCKQGQIDVETDGDTYHLERSQISRDNTRNNSLQIGNWIVLRFNTSQISKHFEKECLGKIQSGINQLGGLKNDGLVPRIFYNHGVNSSQQLTLFENEISKYRADSMAESEIAIDD